MARTSAEREAAIAAAMAGDDDRTTHRIWTGKEWVDLSVYSVPVDALVLNVENRRFAAERQWAEAELGRALDSDNSPDDERSIEALLLDKNLRVIDGQIVGKPSDAYISLRNDWLRRRQESPLWIRPDGRVRNGNRRLAMIKRLSRDQGDEGLQFVNAVVLDPHDFDERTVFEMEQKEQVTENFKVRYDDIDYLIALREAAMMREVDLLDADSIAEVAGELQTLWEKSKQEVERDLHAIRYMDAFLVSMGQAGQYYRLVGTLEIFRDIGRGMSRFLESYPAEADLALQVFFSAVQSGKRYGDIRRLRRLFTDDHEAFVALAEEILGIEDEFFEEHADPTSLTSPTEIDSEPDDDGDAAESGGQATADNYPSSDVSTAIDVAIDAFDSRDRDVAAAIREAHNRLKAIDRAALQALLERTDGADAARAALISIIAWVDTHRSLVE